MILITSGGIILESYGGNGKRTILAKCSTFERHVTLTYRNKEESQLR